MQRINFDTLGPFPAYQEYTFILVLVVSFTRFTELYPLKATDAKEAAQRLLEFVGRYGCPEELLTDGGTQFANETLAELKELIGAEHLITTPYSKEENAIVERTNKEVLEHLKEFTYDNFVREKWPQYLPLIQRIINSSTHESIGTSPASLVFGNQVQLDKNILVPFSHNTDPNRKYSDYVSDLLKAQTRILARAQQIQRAKDAKHISSRNTLPTEFPPNSYVLVQYPLTRMGRRPPTKLHAPWRGPLRVIQNLGPKYSLQNLVTGKTEDVHISLLKAFEYDPTVINPYEIALQDDGDKLIEIVLQHRGNSRRVHTLEFLVRYYSDNPDNIIEKWERYHDIVNNVVLHQYLRQNKMKTLIPKNFR